MSSSHPTIVRPRADSSRAATTPKRASRPKKEPGNCVAATIPPRPVPDIRVDPEEIADEAYATPARPILSRAIAGALGDVAGGEWRQGGGMGEPHGGR